MFFFLLDSWWNCLQEFYCMITSLCYWLQVLNPLSKNSKIFCTHPAWSFTDDLHMYRTVWLPVSVSFCSYRTVRWLFLALSSSLRRLAACSSASNLVLTSRGTQWLFLSSRASLCASMSFRYPSRASGSSDSATVKPARWHKCGDQPWRPWQNI